MVETTERETDPHRHKEHDMANATADQIAQAASLREQARQGRVRSLESFDRCDTDGCVSQWASDSMAQLYTAQAEILENGGVAQFPALFDLDGNIVDAREVQTRYGFAWAITNTNGSTTWFNASRAQDDKRRIDTDRKKGYYVGTVEAPAWARHISSAGLWLSVHVYRTTRGNDGVRVIDNGK